MARNRRLGAIGLGPIFVLLAAVGFLALLLSPLPMVWLRSQRTDWDELSQVGEAYGGASALLSGIALSGIAVSLLLQWRQLRSSLLYSIKQRHFELVKLTLDDPRFLYVDGTEVAADPEARLKVYGNLLVNHWALTWDLGFMDEAALRENARRFFRSATARAWWTTWGRSYLGVRHRRRFVEALTDECERATHEAAVLRTASEATSQSRAHVIGMPSNAVRSLTEAIPLLCAAGIGAMVCAYIWRRRNAPIDESIRP